MSRQDEWLSITEAAELSGYYHDHLRVLIRKGHITATKKEGRWRVNRQSLLTYMKKAEGKDDKRWGPKE